MYFCLAIDRYTAVCLHWSARNRQKWTHTVCWLIWLISTVVVTPLFIYTDIEYKNPNSNSKEAVCIYTFPDIEMVTGDLSTDLDLSLKIRNITNLPRLDKVYVCTRDIYTRLIGTRNLCRVNQHVVQSFYLMKNYTVWFSSWGGIFKPYFSWLALCWKRFNHLP